MTDLTQADEDTEQPKESDRADVPVPSRCPKRRQGDGKQCVRPMDHPGDCAAFWGSTTADFGHGDALVLRASSCCKAEVRVGGDDDEGTRYFVCCECGKACGQVSA